MQRDIVCGLDIGSSSTRALIAHAEQGRLLGWAECPTRGFSKSVVSNLASLSDSIESAVMKAEEKARSRVRKVITNISGVNIRTFQSRGSVHISDRPIEITAQDIARCIESAKLIAMSLDREPVHIVPVRFFIDDKMEITEPLGLFGSKLDVDLNIITALSTVIQNITKAVNVAGYEVEDMIVSGAGTGLAIFDKAELENGAIVIDVGKEVTEATVFIDAKLRNSFNFPFGGDDLTQALQDNIKIMFDEADQLRIKYGVVTRDISRLDDSQIVLSSKSEGISRSRIADILLPNVEAVFEDVYKKLEQFLKTKKSLPHINVVGGVSKMDGFIETVEEVFKVPVYMGRIKGTEELKDISFACSLGLTRYGMQKMASRKPKYMMNSGNFFANTITKARKLFSEYF